MQDIYVGDTGKGFPLVLIHGFLGSETMWEPQVKYFKQKYRIITPDLPGFGRSNKIESKNNLSDIAKIVLKSLESKNIDKFFLLGHSMGGMVVQEMTKLAGNKIIKLICYGTGPVGDIPGRFETIDETRYKLKRNGLNITSHRIAKTWFVNEDKAKYFYLCENSGKATSLKAADNALITMKMWNGLESLKYIKNPTLIIWGDQDKAYNFDQVNLLKKNITNSELKIFKGCSHNVHLEKPDEFNKYIEYFLEKKH